MDRAPPSTSKPRFRHPTLLVGSLVLASAALPLPAWAGEREWVVTPALGYAAIRASGRTAHGGTALFEVDYGLTDAWSLRAAGRYALAWAPSPEGGPLHLGSLALGALYTFDVLKVIPWVGLALGASLIHGAGEDRRVNAELQALLGADYLVRRDFSVGFAITYALQVPDAARFPWMFGLVLRLSYRAQ